MPSRSSEVHKDPRVNKAEGEGVPWVDGRPALDRPLIDKCPVQTSQVAHLQPIALYLDDCMMPGDIRGVDDEIIVKGATNGRFPLVYPVRDALQVVRC